LLEAMQEQQVTVDGSTHPLPRPFLVQATQNPIEYEGTFPLPEAQLDRFLIRRTMGYPTAGDEKTLLVNLRREHLILRLEQVAERAVMMELQKQVWEIRIDDTLQDYSVHLTGRTRSHPVSPEKARHVRRVWDTIRPALRSSRQKNEIPQQPISGKAGGVQNE
jgi:MoxR-like ATPase